MAAPAMTLESIAQIFEFPAVRAYVDAHSYAWPVCEIIHYAGMSLIIGLIGAPDLCILGLFKTIPVRAPRPLVPLAVAGLIVPSRSRWRRWFWLR